MGIWDDVGLVGRKLGRKNLSASGVLENLKNFIELVHVSDSRRILV